MKSHTHLALAAIILTVNLTARAETVRGHFRSNGTSVMPYYRTPANGTPYDNLSYRGYPSQQPGYVSPRSFGVDSAWSQPKTMPSYGNSRFDAGLLPSTGSYTPKPLWGNSRSSGLGF